VSWEDEIEGSQYVYSGARSEMADALARVRAVGAKSLSYVGVGMTALILRENEVAFKVGRDVTPVTYSWLEAEHEWLVDAHGVDPSHVVRPLGWFPDQLVLVHDYVEGRPFGWAPREVHDHWLELAKSMLPLDWGMPEYKDDSYVKTETGFVLVAATMANRLCGRLVAWLEEYLEGTRNPWTVGSLSHDTLAFLVRREVSEGCVDPAIGARLEARLAEGKEATRGKRS
jgi:hypothetical protein